MALYLVAGLWSYMYLGNSAKGMMITNLSLGPASQSASFFLHVQILIAFTLQGVVVSQKFHRTFHPDSVHDYTWRGRIIYFGMTFVTVLICFVIANVIPFFVELTGLIGALFSPWSGYLLPYALVLKARSDSKKKTPMLELIFIIVMTFFMLSVWGVGIYSSIVLILDQWDTYGVPFHCNV